MIIGRLKTILPSRELRADCVQEIRSSFLSLFGALLLGVVSLPSQAQETQRLLPGVTIAAESWRVTTIVDGLVKEIHFSEGQMVKKGDLIVSFDPTISDLNVRLAQSKVDRAELVVADKDLDLKRMGELQKRNATSISALEDAEYAYKEALLDLDVANAELELAKTRRAAHDIVAAADGMISQPYIFEGELFKTALSGPLAQIVQLDPIHVRIPIVPADVINRLREGGYTLEAAREIEFEMILPDGSVFGEIGKPYAVGFELNPESGEGSVLIEFANPNGILRPGLPVQLRRVK
jgi:RND family efflux transporter MFP subunit